MGMETNYAIPCIFGPLSQKPSGWSYLGRFCCWNHECDYSYLRCRDFTPKRLGLVSGLHAQVVRFGFALANFAY
ncbi:hypothetical protein Hypma_009201 [Hypsizygus marmoreus]|uniref:Uncharacterized protein n=1 Tax=Hypsizygus marmoreus TaxID=39966 RepID=A0A369JRN1_HYPMA|nr:hypothetical protein Hypma_009201 [Hypsizygus marmoreus]